MNRNSVNTQASLLDRLIDQEPGVSSEPVQYRLGSFSQAKAAVGRDLENLLNSKNFVGALPAALKQCAASVLAYGLPDFTSTNPRNPAVKVKLRQEMERAIRLFEPRLRNVTVRVEDSDSNVRSLKFRISALLVIDPLTEPVRFDTVFDVNRGEYTISA